MLYILLLNFYLLRISVLKLLFCHFGRHILLQYNSHAWAHSPRSNVIYWITSLDHMPPFFLGLARLPSDGLWRFYTGPFYTSIFHMYLLSLRHFWQIRLTKQEMLFHIWFPYDSNMNIHNCMLFWYHINIASVLSYLTFEMLLLTMPNLHLCFNYYVTEATFYMARVGCFYGCCWVDILCCQSYTELIFVQ